MRIIVDGQEIFDGNNHTLQNTIIGHEPCEEYSIPNLRTRCRSGYRQVDNSRYRWTRRVYRYRSGVVVQQYTENGQWQSTPPTLPTAIGTQGGNGTYRFAATLDTDANYSCVPEAGCQGLAITETIETNSGNYQHRFSVDIARTQAEQDAIDLAADQAAQRPETAPTPIPPQSPTEVEEAIQDLAEVIEENTRVAEELLNKEDDDTRILQPVETTEDTKYRLITPLEYERVGGKIVPRIRYESVRYLSPANVASFVSRGYTVEAVNPNTPISSSKPYGKTLVERAHILTPPSVKTRDIFTRTRKSGQQIIAERQGREYKPNINKPKARRVVR